jgi:hypothetical protein
LRKFAKTWESMKNLHSVLKAKKVCKSMRNCAQSWEVCLKYEKMCLLQFLQYKCFFVLQMIIFWECSTNFFVCNTNFFCALEKNFERAVQTFAALWCEFCRLMARVLPPYGLCFAALCNFWSAVQKSVAFF